MVLILAALFALPLSLAYWFYVLWPVFNGTSKIVALNWSRAAMLQVPISFSLVMALLGFLSSLMFLICPPILAFYAIYLFQFPALLMPIFIASSLVAAAAFYGFRLLFPAIGYWAWTVSTLSFVASFFFTGDILTKQLQGKIITERKFDCISIKSFRDSLVLANEEFKFQFYTAGMKGGKPFGWSFKAMDFFEIPESTFKDIGPIC